MKESPPSKTECVVETASGPAGSWGKMGIKVRARKKGRKEPRAQKNIKWIGEKAWGVNGRGYSNLARASAVF